ncbi:tetratricopeptide repeat protein [Phenylobacterium sp.]|uniref:O-linked N-acetylglucosamine transferase, SPINDLY family protein n=1 Tax=Phenylobacterium sp. TaxID=1871053 RepID=UPI002C2DC343|nr:tetratricopeptide repeat protein [Phenylobacterium sp.]HVI33946.1 tetratricopeptide repeat protein [Phenylobacterium sp.]
MDEKAGGSDAAAERAKVVALIRAGRLVEAEACSQAAAARTPQDAELWGLRGVALRRLGRRNEARAAFKRALQLRPEDAAVRYSYGLLLMEIGDFVAAEATFATLLAAQPGASEVHRQLARARVKLGRTEAALASLREAVALDPKAMDAWLDLIGVSADGADGAGAEAAFQAAAAANPGEPRLLRAWLMALKRLGRPRDAEAFLLERLPGLDAGAWAHFELALLVRDPGAALDHLRRAVALEPGNLDYRAALSAHLQASRTADEGARVEESYRIIREALDRGEAFGAGHAQAAVEALQRVCAFDDVERLGDFRALGRLWASAGLHAALLRQLPRVRTDEDRRELLEQHRIWGRAAEAEAARRPIRRAGRAAAGERLRVGFLSSVLRGHVAAYFALPLFEHLDRSRFEVFCYATHRGPEHPVQAHIAERVTAYRWAPDAPARDVAQTIADDGLDVLVEIGGSTDGNRLAALAYRPAPRQASWLGYPHSTGLATVDHLICDPYCRPPDPGLLAEQPLVMPATWLTLAEEAFPLLRPMRAEIPEDRNGFVTFGTANSPYKFTPMVLRAWARVLAAVPGSRFAFVRPEAGAPTFRRNVLAAFAEQGVDEARIDFHAVRGQHMAYYDEIDITLDTFPLTGGTTTAEALWMGVPVVSLVGPAMFERLSYSLLTNAGLVDLCACDLDTYHATAVALAAEPERRRRLKSTLRGEIRSGPLGRTEDFARDFYALLARAAGRDHPADI